MASTIMQLGRLLNFNRLYRTTNSNFLKPTFRPNIGFRRNQITGQTDGKTTVTIINKDQEYLLINAFSAVGFRLNNSMMAVGPIAIFPKTVLSWNVKNVEDINENSLSLFYLLEPKLDIIVIGVGDKGNKLPESVRKFLHTKRISYEILPTEQACAIFNFLNSEGRYVAGAIIPPSTIKLDEDDLFDTQERRKQLFISQD